jgi:phage repressor protein C with HTH and peptisase S24 domain
MTTAQERDRDMLTQLATATGKNLSTIAREAGVAVTTLTRLANHKTGHRLSASTIEKLQATYPEFFVDADVPSDLPSYVEVEVLPSFAGAGGGGFGEGEPGRALVPRQLVEERLRANPAELLLLDVRGDSMEPDFFHGDQILVDRRDTDPRQPGAFALWDGEGYVVKLIEKLPTRPGVLRIFSANQRYTAYEINIDDARILGRTVWFSRAL